LSEEVEMNIRGPPSLTSAVLKRRETPDQITPDEKFYPTSGRFYDIC